MSRQASNAHASPWLRNLPNALSAMRIVLAGAFPFIAPQWRLIVIIIAAVSDAADGFIARRYNVGSALGALLDAIADKAFVLSVLLTLVFVGPVEWWQLALVLLRDFAVLAVAVYATAVRDWSAFHRMTPGVMGKLTTGFVFAWFIVVIAQWEVAATILFMLAALCSALAAGIYLVRFAQALHLRNTTGET